MAEITIMGEDDLLSDSRDVINNNFTALNNEKSETTHNHVAADVEESSERQFASDDEKEVWNGKADVHSHPYIGTTGANSIDGSLSITEALNLGFTEKQTAGITSVFTEQGDDGFVRKMSAAILKDQLGIVTPPRNATNRTPSGYWRCGDTGVVIQWGITPVLPPSFSAATVTFYTTFPSICAFGIIAPVNALASSEKNAFGLIESKGRSSMVIRNDCNVGMAHNYLAIGY